uniref:Uncharacterized protein n=1 Tax=Oryza sativa subsp. japonica TaxID=39947 RepID=Q67X20_ORYSJ|nr:hypothetical protein [Oryza sativa Japonica Group]
MRDEMTARQRPQEGHDASSVIVADLVEAGLGFHPPLTTCESTTNAAKLHHRPTSADMWDHCTGVPRRPAFVHRRPHRTHRQLLLLLEPCPPPSPLLTNARLDNEPLRARGRDRIERDGDGSHGGGSPWLPRHGSLAIACSLRLAGDDGRSLKELVGGGNDMEVVNGEDERRTAKHDDRVEWEAVGVGSSMGKGRRRPPSRSCFCTTSVIAKPPSHEVEHVLHLDMAPTHDVKRRHTLVALDLMSGDRRQTPLAGLARGDGAAPDRVGGGMEGEASINGWWAAGGGRQDLAPRTSPLTSHREEN